MTSFPQPRASGQVLLISLVFLGIFMAISTAFLGSVVAYTKSERVIVAQTQARGLAEAAIDLAVYQLNQSSSYVGETNTALGAGTFTTTVTSVDGSTKRVTATATIPHTTTPLATKVISVLVGTTNTSISFNYGVQSGEGGVTMGNSSQIIGNVHSSGPLYLNNSSGITGSAISAGSAGLIDGVGSTITGSAYAHTLRDVRAGSNAYYVTATNVTAGGSNCPNSYCHAGSPDQATVPLPISDDQISAWESEAAAGGTITSCDGSGDYTLNTNTTIGPKKIACNLVLSGGATITVAGPLWVTGNITTNNSVTIKMATSLGSQNVAIIADDPANPTTRGTISINGSGQFQGSGSSGSYVFIISQNKSAEQGGSTTAISIGQSSSVLVLYASHGKITLSNSVNLKGVTAYLTTLSNSASVTYDSGLSHTTFQSGSGGSWAYIPGSYGVVP